MREDIPIARSTARSRPSLATLAAVACVALLAASGCAGRAWKAALAEDSAAGYHRFLREYPDTAYAESAHERIDFLKLRREPTLASFREFERKYPASELIDSLRDELERLSFEAARAAGSAAAYEQFTRDFPNGALRARADGSAA
mgnify:CR=1 FL=1